MIKNPAMTDKSNHGASQIPSAGGHAGTYSPLAQMVALVPLLLFYELSILLMDLRGMAPLDSRTQDVLSKVGLSAYYLPGVLVLLALMGIHLYRRDPWKIDASQLWKLWGEALLLTVPLFIIYLLFTAPVHKYIACQLSMLSEGGRRFDFANVVMGTGEAIFEEFVFRLLALPLLMLLLLKLFRLPVRMAEIIAICLSAAIFAAGHHIVPGAAPSHTDFLFRVAAGMYLAAMFLMRGFASVAIIHATYNVAAMTFNYLA